MSQKKSVVVSPEREINIGSVVTDLLFLLDCDTSIPKPVVQFNSMAIANYWLGRENQPPLYQITCRGAAQQGQAHLDKAYQFEVSSLSEELISEELERRIKETITKTPSQ